MPSTPLTPWDHMNVRHAVPQAQHRHWSSHSWTIRCVIYRISGSSTVAYVPFASDPYPTYARFYLLSRPIHNRYTSRTSSHQRVHHIQSTCRCRMSSLSSSIRSQARPSVTSRSARLFSSARPVLLADVRFLSLALGRRRSGDVCDPCQGPVRSGS